jgi:hypothetical protein
MKMKLKIVCICLLFLISVSSQAQKVWQTLTYPTYKEMEAQLKNYPAPYAETLTWGLEGPLSREFVIKDLDAMSKQGIRSVTIEGGYHMKDAYLSPGYFETVKIIVEELKKRNMHLWIIDEGKYPSGFAGGKFSQERPDLRMQGLVVSKRITLQQGETTNEKLDPSVISAVAVDPIANTNEIIDISSGNLNYTAKNSNRQLMLVQHRFKTSVTRAANNPTGGKDTANSLCDYLDPAATRQFLEFTHVQYKKYIGDEFGKTVLGFRGDEPEYKFTPWTPQLISIFKSKKGYDVTPYIATFFTKTMDEKQKLARADFWDVWSDLFRDNFFKVQADWCATNGLEYMVHIDHEDQLMNLARTEGDYFKDMRYVQIPGVDAIWHQIWYDNVADFPKIASSAAHMYGRPRALSETFAAFTPKPTVADALWVINEEMIRGINLFEYMFWPSSATGRSGPSGYLAAPEFAALEEYSCRASFLLASGHPAAQVGLYCPTESMWLGDDAVDKSLLAISKQLLEHQIDFDYVDNQGLADVFKLEKGVFTNLSNQQYRTIIVPKISVMSAQAMERLKAFTDGGGKVIFTDNLPAMVNGKTFIDAKPAPAFAKAIINNANLLKDELLQNVITRDVTLAQAIPGIKYLHRSWKDTQFYFFFNESDQKQSTTATLNGAGKVEDWDANSATVSAIAGTKTKNGKTDVPLVLDPHQTKFIIIHQTNP